MIRRRRGAAVGAACLAPLVALGLTACGTAASGQTAAAPDGRRVIAVAASINAWGSILAQLGGTHVAATSIVTNPATDPHDYEPTPRDAVVIARARLFVENGIGYDTWAARSLAADREPGRQVIDVGRLVHVPADGNPHRWYSPRDVAAVADAVTADLTRLDPADAGYFAAQHSRFVARGLARYDAVIAGIRSRYAGVSVGASESIVSPLAQALGLDLVTPATFLRATSEGTDPSTSDLDTIRAQIARHEIKVYVYNRQNATPDVAAQVRAARAAHIPVTTVTETLTPAGASFQQWQVTQLTALAAALHEATGR